MRTAMVATVIEIPRIADAVEFQPRDLQQAAINFSIIFRSWREWRHKRQGSRRADSVRQGAVRLPSSSQ